MTSHKLTVLAPTLLAFGLAQASAVNIVFQGVYDGNHIVRPNTSGGIALDMAIPGQVDNTVAGLYRVTADGVGQDVFCVDPYQSISFGGSYSGYTLYTDLNILKNIPVGVGSSVHHLDDDDLTQITQIWATYYDGLGALSGSSFLNESAAMQLAIWEIVCGDATQQVTASPSLTKGLCYVSSNDANDIAAAVRANAMLANPSYASIAGAHLAAYVSANQQDFIFVTITSPPAMDGGVTCAMLGLGLLGLTGVKRYGTRRELAC